MQAVTVIKTFDGVLHPNTKEAKKHLDKLYGDELLKHARQLANQNYTRVSDYLDEKLNGFLHLSEIKADMETVEDD